MIMLTEENGTRAFNWDLSVKEYMLNRSYTSINEIYLLREIRQCDQHDLPKPAPKEKPNKLIVSHFVCKTFV